MTLVDKIRGLRFPLKLLVAFIAGILMVPAMPPFGLWPLLLVGFTVFYILLSNMSGLRAAALGWCFGFGYFAAGLAWIANALLVPGNDYAWVYPLAIAGLPAILAFFTAFASWLARYKQTNAATIGGYLWFCAALCLAEFLRGHVFTGYPWNLYGYTWANFLPVAQLAAVGGSYFLTLVTLLWAALPGYALLAPRTQAVRALLLGFVSFGLVISYGAVRLHLNPTEMRHDTVVRVVQPNIAQEDKWNPRKGPQNFEKHLLLSQPDKEFADKTTVLIWPETAVPFYIMNDSSAQAMLRSILADYEMPVYLITGLLRREAEAGAPQESEKFFNSLVVLDREAAPLAIYDKARLVPFGEFIPFQKYVPFGPFVKFSGFQSGPGPRTLGIRSLPHFSPLICYEVIFPGAVTDKDGPRPEWLVNITNDAWYGDSAGPRQHFAMALFRAIEEGVPAVRAANTGISGVIDGTGRTLQKIPLFTENGRSIALPKPLTHATLFSRFGNWVFIASWIVLLGTAVIFIRKKP